MTEHEQQELPGGAPGDVAALARPSTLRKVQQIFDAARTVFLEFGYDASSMEVIAKRAGVSKATVYAHFTNKEDLFEAMIRQECRTITDGIYKPDASSDDLAGELRKMAWNITAMFVGGDGLALYRILVPVAPRFPRLGAILYTEGPLAGRQTFAAFLREAQGRGRLTVPDPDLAAEQFISLIRGDLDLDGTLMLAPRPKRDVEALIEGGIRLFLGAYRAEPTPRPPTPARGPHG